MTLLRCFIAFCSVGLVRADVSVASLFTDHAVLQQGTDVPIWGWAEPGEPVQVSYRRSTASTRAGSDGRWQVSLGTLRPGAASELVIAGRNTIRLRDVVVGEVWLCSGQSNMQWPVREASQAREEIAAADWPAIREFAVREQAAERPVDDVTGTWIPCDPNSVGEFSAIGTYFARELHRRLGVPIGIIRASVGGTVIESWLSRETLAQNHRFTPVQERWQAVLAEYPRRRSEYEAALTWWENASGKERLDAARRGIRKPKPPAGPGSREAPGSLFNGMIHPLAPYAVRGVLWYQGESNASRASEYEALLVALIQDWRVRWGQGDFPFYFVQLPNYEARSASGADWAWLREAQLRALSEPNTAMAVTIDLGACDDLHPPNKQAFAHRLALLARARLYGERVTFSGPVFRSIEREGAALRVRFDHVGDGLVARDGDLREFEIAGADRRFVPAAAEIDGDSVVVASPAVPEPLAVRYAWRDCPNVALFNAAGLPAAPLRSDDW